MITEYTAKYAPSVLTLDVNSDNSLSQDNRQSTDMNNDDAVEVGNETEILCVRVDFLLKISAINNACDAMRNLLQDLLVQN